MRKKIGVFLLFIPVIFFLISSSPVYAEITCTNPDEIATDLGCLPQDPVGFVEKFYGWGLSLIGFVGVLFMIIGGYYIMMSRGNTETLAKGKSFIYYALAGILLAIFGFIFIEIVTGQVLKIPGFN